MVRLARKDPKVDAALLDPWDPLDLMVLRVFMDPRDLKETAVRWAMRVWWVTKARLDPRETMVPVASKARLDKLVPLVLWAPVAAMELTALKVCLVSRAPAVALAWLVARDTWAPLARMALTVCKENKALAARLAQSAT